MSDDDEKNVVAMTSKPDPLAAAIEQERRSIDVLIAYYPLLAKKRRAAYQAHLKEGFNKAQAIELIKEIK